MGARTVPVLWVTCGKHFRKPLNREGLYIGFCGETGRVYTFSNIFSAIIVKDIVINGGCEEAERCINMDCSYNRATAESYSKAKGWKRKLTAKQ